MFDENKFRAFKQGTISHTEDLAIEPGVFVKLNVEEGDSGPIGVIDLNVRNAKQLELTEEKLASLVNEVWFKEIRDTVEIFEPEKAEVNYTTVAAREVEDMLI